VNIEFSVGKKTENNDLNILTNVWFVPKGEVNIEEIKLNIFKEDYWFDR